MDEMSVTEKRKPRRSFAALGIGLASIVLAAGVLGAVYYRPSGGETPAPQPASGSDAPAASAETAVPPPAAAHLPLPEEVRGFYVTASTASSFSRYSGLLDELKAKGANAVVLDVKGSDGSLAFQPNGAALAKEAPIKILMPDFDKIVAATHAAGFYLIARYPVFEDPAFAYKNPELALHVASGALWKDAKGLAWLDPAAEKAWDYNAAVAEEAYARGVDEIQFDYVRFATDGSTSRIVYPFYDASRETMRQAIGRFFAYLDGRLRGAGIPISADLFGFTTWHQNDLGIGQWYADALVHFDFVSAMVYPSHYPSGTLGFANPADHPYAIVSDSLKKGNEANSELAAADASSPLARARPWLQAFDLGAVYTPAMIAEQMRAARETGASGFLMWNAGNRYSALPDLKP